MRYILETEFDKVCDELNSISDLSSTQKYSSINDIPNTMGIYRIASKIEDSNYIGNHECYIGLTVHFRERLIEHLKRAFKRGKEYDKALYRAIRKHCNGDPNNFFKAFTYEILEQINDPDLLSDAEEKYITEYNSYYNGYNETKGGEGGYKVDTLDHWHTALTKEEVIYIRNQLNACNKSMIDIYYQFETLISWKNFKRACYGKYWKDGTWKDLEPAMSEEALKYHRHNNLSRPGELNPRAKVTAKQVLDWRRRLILGEPAIEIYKSDVKAQELFPNYKSFQNIVSVRSKTWPTVWPAEVKEKRVKED